MTMMVTNAILGGIADTVAQSITAIRQRGIRKPGGASKDDTFAIEIHELGRKHPVYERELTPDSKSLAPPFDFERLTRFMAYGFCIAPLQFQWFRFLSRAFPMTKASAFGPAMKRVVFDQLVYAPFGVGLFFVVMTVAEGGGRRAVSHKLRDMYVPTLKANYMVWPAVQIVNFRLMPVQFQLVRLAAPQTPSPPPWSKTQLGGRVPPSPPAPVSVSVRCVCCRLLSPALAAQGAHGSRCCLLTAATALCLDDWHRLDGLLVPHQCLGLTAPPPLSGPTGPLSTAPCGVWRILYSAW